MHIDTLTIIIAIVAVGATLGTLIMRAIGRLDRRIDGLDKSQVELRERMAKFEAFLEVMREDLRDLRGRFAPPPEAAD